MMVDPMFMIVENLRLFQTAVTPTVVTLVAVAPTTVILINKVILHQFKHLSLSQMVISVYLYTCVFSLCTCQLVFFVYLW